MPYEDPATGQKFWTLTEIANRWGVNLSTVVRRDVQEGNLKVSRRMGRSKLVSDADLLVYEKRVCRALKKRIRADLAVLKRLSCLSSDCC